MLLLARDERVRIFSSQYNMMARNSIILFTSILCKSLYPTTTNPTKVHDQESFVVERPPFQHSTNAPAAPSNSIEIQTKYVTITQHSDLSIPTTTIYIPSPTPTNSETIEGVFPYCDVYTALDSPWWLYLSYILTALGALEHFAQYRRNKKLKHQLQLKQEHIETLAENMADLNSVYGAVIEQGNSKSLECTEAWRAQAKANSRADRAEMETLHARERAAIFAERHTQMLDLTERHEKEIRQLEVKLQRTQAYCENLLLKLPSMLFPPAAVSLTPRIEDHRSETSMDQDLQNMMGQVIGVQ